MSVNIGNRWDELLKDEWDKDYYKKIREVLIHDYQNYRVYPDMNYIFEALKLVPFEDCKVVILGQDPYHNPNQAHGLSFSVKPNVKTPPSLINIYKELQNEFGYPIPNNGYLMKWAKQGVLLLNASLSVEKGKPNSHKDFGWHLFSDAVIKKISDEKNGVIFLLWGNFAKNKANLIDQNKHFILTAPHPSPLARGGFFGCKHFSKTNEILKKLGKSPIDWDLNNFI